MIIVNGWKPLTIIKRSSILDITAVLDPPLYISSWKVPDQAFAALIIHRNYFSHIGNTNLLSCLSS